MTIPLSRPDLTGLERRRVLEVLRTPQLSLGPRLAAFEEAFAARLGVRHAVAVNSGTSGLHLGVRALGIGEGDEVLTTPFSFIASANAVLFERARPVFVDIDERTLNIDPGRLRDEVRRRRVRGRKLKAVLPVHVFGRACDMKEILAVARENDLAVIEDACEALGAEIRIGRRWAKAGALGDCGVFGFYPNKQITTGEGGVLVTNDGTIARLCRSLRNQGRPESGRWLRHVRLGFNYRLSDINCALGIAQLERLDAILARRARVAAFYRARLAGIEDLILPAEDEDKRIGWFVYVVRLSGRFSGRDRNRLLDHLRSGGVECGSYFPAIHLQPFYRKLFGYRAGDFPLTERAADRTIALPFFNRLTEAEVDAVCRRLIAGLRSAGRAGYSRTRTGGR